MANEVELITFANKTVSPVYDAIIQELYTDGGGVITGCTVTIKDANHLHITEGYGVLCGREFKIVASDIPVQLSSSGNLNGRLYLHMDLSLATDPITLLVETGSTLTPVQQDANVNTTNGVYEINLATFTVGTSAISNLQDVAPKAVKIPDALNTLNSNLSKNAFGTAIVVVASTTSLPANQWYEIPADGYIIISALGEQARKAWVSGSIYGPSKTGAHFNWEVYCPLESNISVVETPVYVKKGMWFFIGGIIGKASVSFIPLA